MMKIMKSKRAIPPAAGVPISTYVLPRINGSYGPPTPDSELARRCRAASSSSGVERASFRREKDVRRESGEQHKSPVAVRTKQAQREGAIAGIDPHRLPGKMRREKQEAALR